MALSTKDTKSGLNDVIEADDESTEYLVRREPQRGRFTNVSDFDNAWKNQSI